MKNYLVVLVAVFLSTPLSLLADPPANANNAEIFKPTFCPFFVIVNPNPDVTALFPGGYGIMVTKLDAEGQLLITGSGKKILNCQGAAKEGETIIGFDAFNPPPAGAFIEAVVAPAYEACVAQNTLFPGTCKGTGTFVVTGDDVEANCNFAGMSTRDWQQVTSRSGQYNLKCRVAN